jgi:hypothetical protein
MNARRRLGIAFAAWAPVLLQQAPARSADARTCAQAYVEAQELKRQHALIEARERLRVCASDLCPSTLRPECTQWLSEVEGALPTVVVVVRTPSGQDVVDVRLYVDGREVAAHLDGTSIEVDPGEHRVRVVRADGVGSERSVLFAQGDKDRRIVFALEEPRAPAPPAPARDPSSDGRRVGPAPYVLAGVALVGLGVGTYFGVSGLAQRAECDPHCTTVDRREISGEKFVAADIGLGVALAAGVVAAYLLFAR